MSLLKRARQKGPLSGTSETKTGRGDEISEELVVAWLVDQVAALLEIRPETIDINQTFDEFGISSVQAVALSGDLSEWLKMDVPATIIWEYPTIELVARQIAREVSGEPAARRHAGFA